MLTYIQNDENVSEINFVNNFNITGFMFTNYPIAEKLVNPSLKDNPVEPFNKVFIMVNTKKEENKRIAEDQLVSMYKKGIAVPSYSYVNPSDTSQKELVEKLIKDGFDGAVTMRLKAVVQTQTKTTSTPGTSYESWYSGPYGYGHSYTYSFDNSQRTSTGNIDVNSPKDYIIETNLFAGDKKASVVKVLRHHLVRKKLIVQ